MSTKKSIRRRLEDFISSDRGQRFFNFAYSIGAAIVIWGALFQILHLPGGSVLLTIGMGTEVIMFFLTAFDRPPVHYANANPTTSVSVRHTAAENEKTDDVAEAMKGVMSEMAKLQEITAKLNTLSEMQLNNVSSQLNTMENGSQNMAAMHELLKNAAEQNRRYYDETVRMTENLSRLNVIYERMIAAMSSTK